MNRKYSIDDSSSFAESPSGIRRGSFTAVGTSSSPYYSKPLPTLGDDASSASRQPRYRVDHLNQQAEDLHHAINSMDVGRGGYPSKGHTSAYAGATTEELASNRSTETTSSPFEDKWRYAHVESPSPTKRYPSYLETSAIGDGDGGSIPSSPGGVDGGTPLRGASAAARARKWRSWLERAKGPGGMGAGGSGPEGWMLRSSSDSSGSDSDDVPGELAGVGAGEEREMSTARAIFLKHLRDMNDYSLDDPPGRPSTMDGFPSPLSGDFAGVSLDAYGEGYAYGSEGGGTSAGHSSIGTSKTSSIPFPPRSQPKLGVEYEEGDGEDAKVGAGKVYAYRSKELERRLKHAESEAAAYADSLSELHSAFERAREEAAEARAREMSLRSQNDRLTQENRRYSTNLAVVEEMFNGKFDLVQAERDLLALQLAGAYEEISVRDAALADSAAYMQSLRRRNAELQVQVRSLLAQRSQQDDAGYVPSRRESGGCNPGQSATDESGVFALANVKRNVEEAVQQLASVSESERKERIKALRLRWHPDKNQVLHEFATEVTKIINEAVQRFPGQQ